MAIEKVKELIRAIKTDPGARETLQGLEKPTDEDGIICYYAEAARKLGFDVMEKDIRVMFSEMTSERTRKTEQAVSDIQTMPDDQLDVVAGGATYKEALCESDYSNEIVEKEEHCFDTYQHRENCWANDGCDHSFNSYAHYECQHNQYGHVCGNQESFNCGSFMF